MEQRLEDKVREYLRKEEIPVVEDNIEYIHLDENRELPGGTVKNVHLVTFARWVFERVTTEIDFILIDEATEELLWMLTPHTYIKISEED